MTADGGNPLIVRPWPKDCQYYQHDNACNTYEISKDGKKVLSCNLARNCKAKPVNKKCIKKYPARNASEPLFGDTGDMCFFEGAALPISPWKKGCKIFQADIDCHSYEISEAATFVKSCELAPIYN